MNTYTLPQELFPPGTPADNSVIIKSYHSESDAIKNKIILRQNMINLLIRGSKTIVYAEETTTISNNEFLILSTGTCLLLQRWPFKD